VNYGAITLTILATLSASFALAEDFKTVNGKEYKGVTISRVEADGIVLRTKSGITKLYFTELPKEVQERFHYRSATPIGKAVTQRIDKPQNANDPAALIADGLAQHADRFAQQVATKLDEREAILQGKRTGTPGPAETMILREFAFHKAFLAGTAIIACLLFAVVWARVR